jgi:hypothetical protein
MRLPCPGHQKPSKVISRTHSHPLREDHGPPCHKTDWQAHAYCLMGNQMGWRAEDLPLLPKGHARKVGVARRLRQETTMSLKWIAQHPQMGSWTYVSNLPHGASTAIQQTQQPLRLYQ